MNSFQSADTFICMKVILEAAIDEFVLFEKRIAGDIFGFDISLINKSAEFLESLKIIQEAKGLNGERVEEFCDEQVELFNMLQEKQNKKERIDNELIKVIVITRIFNPELLLTQNDIDQFLLQMKIMDLEEKLESL